VVEEDSHVLRGKGLEEDTSIVRILVACKLHPRAE
jgi:hypothetical protein